MKDIAIGAADAVSILIDEKNNKFKKLPYAFFGHCMGAQINYETVCELNRRKLPLPKSFYVYCAHSPNISNGLFPSYNMDDEKILQFIAQVNSGELPKALKNKETNKLVLDIMRADLECVASQKIELKDDIIYHHILKENIPKFDMNIQAWYGDKDPFVPKKFVEEWKNLISNKENFKIDIVDGDHYPYVTVEGDIKDKKQIEVIVDKIHQIV
jgi:surfactin synthase thioesterase subunit